MTRILCFLLKKRSRVIFIWVKVIDRDEDI